MRDDEIFKIIEHCQPSEYDGRSDVVRPPSAVTWGNPQRTDDKRSQTILILSLPGIRTRNMKDEKPSQTSLNCMLNRVKTSDVLCQDSVNAFCDDFNVCYEAMLCSRLAISVHAEFGIHTSG